MCMKERDSLSVCVCEREREREALKARTCVCVWVRYGENKEDKGACREVRE